MQSSSTLVQHARRLRVARSGAHGGASSALRQRRPASAALPNAPQLSAWLGRAGAMLASSEPVWPFGAPSQD